MSSFVICFGIRSGISLRIASRIASSSPALSWDDSRVLIHRVAMDRLLEKYGVEGKQFWLGFGGYSKIPKMGSGGNCVKVDYHGKEEILQIHYSNSENNFWIALVKQMP